jgi:Clp amino terminal domain, pathogenicity island component
MFNLDEAISEWRQQLTAGGIKSSEVLDELESHLRDDIQQQMRSGVTEQEAFEAGINRMGRTNLLKSEFDKVGSTKWQKLRKLRAMLLGFLGLKEAFPFPDLRAFTPGSVHALELAGEEAPRLGHDFIGTEHVLLGLMQLEDGVVPKVLARIGVDHTAIRKEIEKFVGIGQVYKPRTAIPYTPRAKRALHLAEQEAKALKHARVGAEHIFLGLLLENEGVAGQVLRSLGVRAEMTRAAILKELAGS